MKKVFASLLSLSILLLAGCAPAANVAAAPSDAASDIAAAPSPEVQPSATTAPEAAAKAEYSKITPEQAKEIMDSNNDVIILDVRTAEEFAEGHIQNAVLLPDSEIRGTAAEVLPDKSAEILAYCRSGRRSAAASKELVDMGYTNVKDFGGIIDWTYETVK